MQNLFKTIRVRRGDTWTVVLTTPEGADHEIAGFHSAAEARDWIEGETGQRVMCPVDSKAA